MRLGELVVRDLIQRFRREELGITIIELSISMAITALLSTVMIVWVFAGFGSDSTHSSYDAALDDLRNVTDRLSSEVRAANHLTAAEEDSLSFWLDANRDGTLDSGELVTWAIQTDGTVVRSTDGGSPGAVLATNLSPTESGFYYDSATPASVTRVSIDLVSLAQTRAGDDEVFHGFDVYLRNA